MGHGGLARWSRVDQAATGMAGADEWRGALAHSIREATAATFTSVLTCPPNQWHGIEHSTAPATYGPLIETVRREFLTRIESAGEDWRYALHRFGTVYAPLESAMARDLAEELRSRLLRPVDIDGYVCGFMLDHRRRLVGLVVLGSDRASGRILETIREPLVGACARAGATLGRALELARACGAVVPEPSRRQLDLLTAREQEIAILASEGLSAVNIAARLAIAEATVAVHLRRIHRKLNVHSRVELTRKLLELDRATSR